LGSGFTSKEIELRSVLEKKGHNVRVAGKTRMAETSKEGTRVMPDMAFYEINPDYFDFVVVTGEEIKEIAKPELIDLIRKCVFEKKGAAGLVAGPTLLAFAGVMGGKRATVANPEKAIKLLRDSEVQYAREIIVADGNIITASSAEPINDIAAAILRIL
jgi:putative intracellular protease/amidase